MSLFINAGEIVSLIGSNGAGKTTLLRTISGLLKPAEGSIELEGTLIAGDPPHQIVRRGLSHSPEGRQVFANMTVRENLLLGGYIRNRIRRPDRAVVHSADGSSTVDGVEYQNSKTLDPDADIAGVFHRFPILAERRDQKAGTLSGGEQQMLAMGRALMQRPKLLLLDEPSLGLAPLIVRKIFQIIKEINAAGTTVFLVEQNAKQALSIAHRAYVLQTGRVIKSDTASKLLDDPDVKAAYLGG